MNATDFLPAIREVATYRVGKYRTDREDIARILFEFGVMGTTAYLRLIHNFTDTPVSPSDAVRVDELWDRARETNVSYRTATRNILVGRMDRGSIECFQAEREIDRIHSKYPLAVDKFNAWILEHFEELCDLCLEVADEILAERSQKS